jgi:hypothetical protein
MRSYSRGPLEAERFACRRQLVAPMVQASLPDLGYGNLCRIGELFLYSGCVALIGVDNEISISCLSLNSEWQEKDQNDISRKILWSNGWHG